VRRNCRKRGSSGRAAERWAGAAWARVVVVCMDVCHPFEIRADPSFPARLPALEGPAAMRRVAEASESRGLVDFFVRYPAAAVERAASACASACWTACLNACELAVAPVTALTLAVCVCTT